MQLFLGLAALLAMQSPSSPSQDSQGGNQEDTSPRAADVWKASTVANTFADIRNSIPLASEQLDLMERVIRCFRDRQTPPIVETWLDLGCGDGPLSKMMLQAFPQSRGFMLDYSDPMLEAAQSSMKSNNDRVQFIKADLSNPDWKNNLSKLNPDIQSFDVIVSGFAIHHLTDDRKRELYQEIYHLLSSDRGVFLNLEHVASTDSTVENIFTGAFVDSMYKTYAGERTRKECEAAVQYDLSVDKDANILVPVEVQCNWLREIGYQHVDCYFKYLILALFGGVKITEE